MVNYTTETTKTPQEALKQANPPQSGRITTTQTGNKSYKQDKLHAQIVKRIHWIKEKKYKEGNIKLSDNNSIFYTHYFFIIQIDIHSPHFVVKRGGFFFLSLFFSLPTHSTHKAQSNTHSSITATHNKGKWLRKPQKK